MGIKFYKDDAKLVNHVTYFFNLPNMCKISISFFFPLSLHEQYFHSLVLTSSRKFINYHKFIVKIYQNIKTKRLRSLNFFKRLYFKKGF